MMTLSTVKLLVIDFLREKSPNRGLSYFGKINVGVQRAIYINHNNTAYAHKHRRGNAKAHPRRQPPPLNPVGKESQAAAVGLLGKCPQAPLLGFAQTRCNSSQLAE